MASSASSSDARSDTVRRSVNEENSSLAARQRLSHASFFALCTLGTARWNFRIDTQDISYSSLTINAAGGSYIEPCKKRCHNPHFLESRLIAPEKSLHLNLHLNSNYGNHRCKALSRIVSGPKCQLEHFPSAVAMSWKSGASGLFGLAPFSAPVTGVLQYSFAEVPPSRTKPHSLLIATSFLSML